MRTQRVLRSDVAASLCCIFCACRLSSLHPSRLPHRRFQSATTASSTTPSSPWYELTSPLSMSEQREKANRMAMRQQLEVERSTARQETLWKEEAERQERLRKERQDVGAKRRKKAKNDAKAHEGRRLAQAKKEETSFRRVGAGVHMPEGRSMPEAVEGTSLSHAMSAGSRRNFRRIGNLSDNSRRRTGDRSPTTSFTKTTSKVSNPFGAPAAATAGSASTAASGWGAGSTGTAPLQYSEATKSTVARSVPRPGEGDGSGEPNANIQDVGAPQIARSGHHKIFKPTYDPTEGEQMEYSRDDVEDLQAQQSVYDQAAKAFIAHSSRKAEVREAYATKPSYESTIPQDPIPSSEEAQSRIEAPAISFSSNPTDSAPALGSLGRFEEDTEPPPKPQRQEPPQIDQKLKDQEQPALVHAESNSGASSSRASAHDAKVMPETKHDDTPQKKNTPVAQTSPLARIAQQTQSTQQQQQQQKTPPPPPTVPPPPPSAVPAGGQLAWQPIEEHAQGGQWVWQAAPAPAFTPTPQPPASQSSTGRVVAERSDTYTSPRSRYIPPVRTPPAPSVSLGDSGYRATPFKADDYQSQSSFDEENAANWQHLRKRNAEPVQTQTASASAPASTLVQQQQNSRIDYDDESWVDRTFNNHVRERKERLKAQQEREQRRLPQQQEREQRDQAQTREYQPPAPRQSEGPRRLYDEPAQTYRDRACARCGEMGHIARFCPKNSPFDMRSTGSRSSNDGRSPRGDRGDRRDSGGTGTSLMRERALEGSQSANPLTSREQGRDRVRSPFESHESGQGQRPRAAWGSDQVFSTEPENEPSGTPRFDFVRRFIPGRGFEDSDAPQKFEPAGGRRSERIHDARDATPGRDTGHRSERFIVGREIDEHAPAPETRQSREKAARKSRWAEAEEEVVKETGRGAVRKAQRAGRREYNEEEDDEAEARDNFRARKAARQAEKEAKEEKRRKDARREREVKKSEDATPISIPEFVSVQQLSQLLGVRYEQFIDRLEQLGYDDVFPGMTLNSETSGMIAMEYNFDPTIDTGVSEEAERDLQPRPELEDQQLLPTRPPVVTIMGHVDHGKTTILDYLRKSSVAAGEAGGITQHIGAFSVPMASSGKTITFLDTPGHAAFLAMRQRGANVTDIVILVVAADDSVKPQTLEAIKHARAAGVPMIVAINKVDKEEADIERVKQDLARHGVEIEDFGGETQIVPVSGKTGKGMDELEETVVALSEILDHRAETDGAVEGWILEATTKERGRVATVLVRRGTLKPGAVIVAGKTWARVRSLRNEGDRVLSEVGPGMPIEVDGWRDQPTAGDEVLQAPTEQKATSVVEFRQEREEREKAAADMQAINTARREASERQQRERDAARALKKAQRTANFEGGTADVAKPDDLDAPEQETTGQIDIPFIIKADVSGSAEAVSAYILSVSNPLITPSILSSQVGPVHESDIELAHAAGGHIIAFNLPPDPVMQGMAESQGVKVLENNIIYRVLDDVKEVLEERLPPIITSRVVGEAEVGAAFEITISGRKKLNIAGCKVRNGMIGRGARVRITRGGEKVYDGTITSLKNVKKDVTEMRKGSECGMGFEGWEGFEVGDLVQTYEEVRERRKL